MDEEVKIVTIKRTKGRIISISLDRQTVTFVKERPDSIKDAIEQQKYNFPTGFCHYKHEHKDDLVKAIQQDLPVDMLIHRMGIFKDGKRKRTRDVLMELRLLPKPKAL